MLAYTLLVYSLSLSNHSKSAPTKINSCNKPAALDSSSKCTQIAREPLALERSPLEGINQSATLESSLHSRLKVPGDSNQAPKWYLINVSVMLLRQELIFLGVGHNFT